MHHVPRLVAFLAIALFTACTDKPPTAPVDRAPPESRAALQDTASIQDVAALRVPLPPVLRPWDTSRVAFVDIVRAEDGHVTFGFKEPASLHVRSTGVRATVSKATILAGHRLLEAAGAKILHPLKHIGAVIVQMDAERAAELRNHPLIDYAEPRRWGRLDGVRGNASSLRAFSAAMVQYSNEVLPWGVSMVHAPEAWDSAQAAGFGANVLIIDTGYERGHADLPVIWYQNCRGAYGGCDDAIGHGTHVTGILTARDNALGVIGVAPGVLDISLVVWGGCRDTDGWCDFEEIARAINDEIGYVDVINMSLGTDDPYEYPINMANAVAAALAADVVVVAAAGNDADNAPHWPASQEGVIGVSGVLNNYEFASTSPCPENPFTGRRPRSNWGQHVDLAAPFFALSTVPPSEYGDHTGTPMGSGQPQFWCGTSMATPHVSGAAAILRGRYPDMSRQLVEAYLFQYAQDRGSYGRDDHYGHGIVDVWNALRHVQWPPPPPPPATATISGASEVQPYATCSWSVTTDLPSPPYTYSWWVDGVLQADEDERFTYTAGASSFSIMARVTNALGQSVWDVHDVTASYSAPECLDY